MTLTGAIENVKDGYLRQHMHLLHDQHKELIESVPASVKYHHNWTGGYQDHVRQVIERAIAIYHQLYTNETKCRHEAGFTLDDVILVAYIHDLDKLYRYERLKTPKDGREWDYCRQDRAYDESAKVATMCARAEIILEDKHLEALAMHHGGWAANNKRDMTPLAVIIHTADLMSTYITNRKGD